MKHRLITLFFLVTAYTMLWSVTLLIMMEDDVAMLALMFT